MIKKILAWAVLAAMAAGLVALAAFLWNYARPAACMLIGAMGGTVFGFLLVWALEAIGWL